ncbi:hypothetical protein KO507_13560 [Gilvimarinus agarilyticus]|uniref:hypothetical protein n=1 Tax=Gilvimarinus sp. 2_MG-2023 TaxID=3062666 RepID=UPI001C0A336A|nr:hypothetical protein [Gilvimarinus sp. 2_MG-2023]MBU2886794.1 hypothetical protein [Gilvimarinus agarilyticus]MDO6571458.1 hypothetical protein [Gilvimarinus sp. 2_MG-2023]
MKKIYLSLLVFLVSGACFANELVISYGPSATIEADTDDSEVNGEPYSYLNLDSGRVTGVRWINRSKSYYIDLTLLDPKKDIPGEYGSGYKSLSAGIRLFQDYVIGENLSAYLGCSTGVGATEFGIEANKVRSMAEASFKGGLIFNDKFTVGPEVKFQFVGRPGETVARVFLFNLNAGIRF